MKIWMRMRMEEEKKQKTKRYVVDGWTRLYGGWHANAGVGPLSFTPPDAPSLLPEATRGGRPRQALT